MEGISLEPQIYYLAEQKERKYYERINLDSHFLSEKSPTIKKAIFFIETNLFEKLKINTIAQNIGCSPSTLRRLFQQEMEQTIYRYIQSRKLEEAYRLISSGKISVVEVCYQVGYSGVSSFIALFNKKYGKTPGQILSHNKK